MRKCVQKYAQNMQPISHHTSTFNTKYDDIFDQKEVLILSASLPQRPQKERSHYASIFMLKIWFPAGSLSFPLCVYVSLSHS